MKKESAMPLVSVIVPVYNVAPYLDKCIGTLLTQTYPNYEVLLVDDGSTDGSGEICDAYAEKHEYVRTFHKENGGLSDARNYGTANAVGELIAFVDSDDYVSDDYIGYLVDLKKRTKSDIAVAKSIGGTNGQYVFDGSVKKEICLKKEEALSAMLYGVPFGVSVCCKIFPKKFVAQYPFPEGILYEDLATTYKFINECHSVAYGDKEIYLYRKREGSIRQQRVTEKHLYGLTVAKNVLDDMKLQCPFAVPGAKSRYARLITEFFPYLLSGSQEDRQMHERLKEELRPFFKTVIADKKAPLPLKMRCSAVMLGYAPMVCLWKTIEKTKAMIMRR